MGNINDGGEGQKATSPSLADVHYQEIGDSVPCSFSQKIEQ